MNQRVTVDQDSLNPHNGDGCESLCYQTSFKHTR